MNNTEQKQRLTDQLTAVQGTDILNDSNYKFLSLLQSRLIEQMIPFDTANMIVSITECSLSAINEEDDYIGDIALLHAEYCGKVYRRLKEIGLHKSLHSDTLRRFYTPFGVIA